MGRKGWNSKINTRTYLARYPLNYLLTFVWSNVFSVLKIPFSFQVIDIPIGFDHLTTFLVNLFLYHHENKWLLSSRKNDFVLARKFRHVFRFLNDLCVIIENSERKKNFKNIYPDEIEL